MDGEIFLMKFLSGMSKGLRSSFLGDNAPAFLRHILKSFVMTEAA